MQSRWSSLKELKQQFVKLEPGQRQARSALFQDKAQQLEQALAAKE